MPRTKKAETSKQPAPGARTRSTEDQRARAIRALVNETLPIDLYDLTERLSDPWEHVVARSASTKTERLTSSVRSRNN